MISCKAISEDFRAEKVDSAVLASVSNNIKRDGNGKSSCDAGTILLSITRMSYLKGETKTQRRRKTPSPKLVAKPDGEEQAKLPQGSKLNMQTVASIFFFYAWSSYGDKDVAMAAALSLETALYSLLEGHSGTPIATAGLAAGQGKHAAPVGPPKPCVKQKQLPSKEEPLQKTGRLSQQRQGVPHEGRGDNATVRRQQRRAVLKEKTAQRAVLLSQQKREVLKEKTAQKAAFLSQQKREVLKEKTAQKAALLSQQRDEGLEGKAQQAAGTSTYQGPEKPGQSNNARLSSSSRASVDKEGSQTSQARKKPKLMPKVFGLEDLCTGLVILVRTEPNGDDGWGLPWSLGRIVRMQPSKKTVDVLWLKPSAGKEAGNSILKQRWLPWTLKEKNHMVEWVSKGLSFNSIQYGLTLPKSGLFNDRDLAVLSAEVARLEAVSADK